MNKIGFGFLRLPRLDPANAQSVDYERLNPMVDAYLRMGGRYFDTAYTYLGGASEEAIRKSLVERHERNTFLLADKLPGYKVQRYEDCRKFFDESRLRCGVDYFDVYLLHWLNGRNYAIAEAQDEFRFLRDLKEEGLAGKIGFSYHDGPELLNRILDAHPEVDYVQLQINYLDWESPSIQAQKCYEVAAKHQKAVLVMEPVKGGTLAQIPDKAAALLPGASPAQWALRFAQSLPGVEIVLSGMSTLEQVVENMAPVQPLSRNQRALCLQAANLLRSDIAIPCTGCGYCASHCPKKIPIPEYFRLYNEYARNPNEDWKIQPIYHGLSQSFGRASECIACRQCEKNCPQRIEISQWLVKVRDALER